MQLKSKWKTKNQKQVCKNKGKKIRAPVEGCPEKY
jgi:hypothetical protein